MKRLTLIALVLSIIIAFTACSQDKKSNESEDDTGTEPKTETQSEGDEKMSDITLKYPSNVFTQSEPIELYYSKSDQEVEWLLLDWKRTEIDNGTWNTNDGPLVFSGVPLGYYLIKIKEKDMEDWQKTIHFAHVVDPDSRNNASNPYGLDTAQSIFNISNILLSDLAVLSGTTMIRDRMKWDSVRIVGDASYWGKMGDTSILLKERNIKIVTPLYSAPNEYKGNLNDLPYDLMALFDFAKIAAAHFSETTPAMEFWNEQDLLEFCTDSAWDFAAAQKVAYLGFKEGNPLVNVLVGSTTQNLNIQFNEVMFANGISSYFDTFNFHTYTTMDQYSNVVKGKLDLLKRWGAEDKPMWVTEFGISLGEAGGKGKAIVSGKTEHDDEQEILHAHYIVKGNIILQSLGVEKNFFFILPPWNDSNNTQVHGLLRHDLSVKPGYVAHANLTAQLGGSYYLGKVDLGNYTEGYLYEQPDGEQTLVFWGRSSILLENQNDKLELVDMMGKKVVIKSENGDLEIEYDMNPRYLHGVRNIEAQSTALIDPNNGNYEHNIDNSIVLRVNLNEKFNILNRVSAQLIEGNDAEIYTDIFNFSNEEKQVELINNSKGCIVNGLPEYITVPPMTKVSLPISIKVSNTSLAELSLTGTTTVGNVSSVYIPISPNLDNDIETKQLEMNASLWQANSSGMMVIEDDVDKGTVRFNVDFSSSQGRWLYPKYNIDTAIMENVIGLSFDIKVEEVEKPFNYIAVICNMLGGGDYHIQYPQPTEEWQTVNIIFRDDAPVGFDAEKIASLSVGFNPDQDKIVYWIRNFQAIYNK